MVKLSSDPLSWLGYALFLAGAPLLAGIINKLKARLSGRAGPTLFQPYHELLRLAAKETVYSTSAGFISRLAPALAWCTVAFAALLLPLGRPAAVSLPGGIILFAYLLALGRFFQILAALDVASSFEGMGASREARFAVFAEPILFFTIGSLAIVTRRYSFEAIFAEISWRDPFFVVFVSVGLLSLFILMTAECSRMPVDDPNTHLELTMIHEGPLLEYAGRDLAFLQWAAAARHWVVLVLASQVFLPHAHRWWLQLVLLPIVLVALCGALAVTETATAKMRILLAPRLLAVGAAAALLGIASWLVQVA
jgi:formate hydrogenlyase subunit 4